VASSGDVVGDLAVSPTAGKPGSASSTATTPRGGFGSVGAITARKKQGEERDRD